MAVMVEYIERERAIQSAKHAWAKGLEPSQYIEIIPSAEVVNVVRCRDCIGRSTWYNDAEYGCAVCTQKRRWLLLIRNTKGRW